VLALQASSPLRHRHLFENTVTTGVAILAILCMTLVGVAPALRAILYLAVRGFYASLSQHGSALHMVSVSCTLFYAVGAVTHIQLV
jgi:hypothetical protein